MLGLIWPDEGALQRGRARESAEIWVFKADTDNRTKLQRGRARESAEMFIASNLNAADFLRFNGAALVRARRFAITRDHAQPFALASTGPRS